MNPKLKYFALILGALLAGTTIAVIAYTLLAEKPFDNHATIEVEGFLTYYIDGEINAESYDWLEMKSGYTYYVDLAVTNNFNTEATIYIRFVDLPTNPDWIFTWSWNNTIWQPFETKNANLELTIPSNAVAGEYTWITTIVASKL